MRAHTYFLTLIKMTNRGAPTWLVHVIGPAGDQGSRLCDVCERDWKRRIVPIRRPESTNEEFDAGSINATTLKRIKKDFVESRPVEGFTVYTRLLDRDPECEYPFLFEE